MAKYKELSKKDKIAFYVGLFFVLVYVVFFCLLLWSVGSHLYHQEYYEAAAKVGLFLTGWFWTTSWKRKKKISELQDEIMILKVTWRKSESDAFMRGWQSAIAFQRGILRQRAGRKASQD